MRLTMGMTDAAPGEDKRIHLAATAEYGDEDGKSARLTVTIDVGWPEGTNASDSDTAVEDAVKCFRAILGDDAMAMIGERIEAELEAQTRGS